MMARKLTSQEVSSLFERKLSERSGLVKDVRSAEFILREYETATVTKFCCSKSTDKGFGNTGERPIFLSYAIAFFPSCNILGLMFLGRHLNKVGGFDLKALRGDGER